MADELAGETPALQGGARLQAEGAALIILRIDGPGNPLIGDPDCDTSEVVDGANLVCVVGLIYGQ